MLAALLGEDHAYFDCDSPRYDKPCSKASDTFNPDFEQEFDGSCVDGEDSCEADSPECDGEGCGKPEEKAVLAEPEDEEPAGEAPQMDMIDGKLVPAKDPEKAEIEIEEEEDDRLNESVSDRREMCSDLYKEICDGQARGEKPSKEKIDEFGKCLGKFKQAMDAERITDAKDEKAYKRLSAAFSELNGALAESGSDDISDEEFLEEFGKKVASRKSKDEKPLKEEADWDSMSEEEFLKAFGKKIKADIAAGKLGKKNA